MSTSDIASKRTVETNTKRNGVGAIVGTTRRSRMFTASSISCSTRNDMNGTPQNNQSNNTKEHIIFDKDPENYVSPEPNNLDIQASFFGDATSTKTSSTKEKTNYENNLDEDDKDDDTNKKLPAAAAEQNEDDQEEQVVGEGGYSMDLQSFFFGSANSDTSSTASKNVDGSLDGKSLDVEDTHPSTAENVQEEGYSSIQASLGKTSPPDTHSTARQEEGNTLNEELGIDMNKKLPSVEQTMKDQEEMEQGHTSGIISDGHTPSNASPIMNREKSDGLDDVLINENEKLPVLQDQKQNDHQFEAPSEGYSLLETQESDIASTTNQAAEGGAGLDNVSDGGSQFVNVENTSTVNMPSRRRRVYGRKGTHAGNRSTESGCSSRKDIRSQGQNKTNSYSCTNNDQSFVSASLKSGESVKDESKREKFVETSVSRKDNTDNTSVNIISRIEVLQQEGQEEPIIEQPRRQSSRNTKDTGEEVKSQKPDYTVTERRSNRKKSAPELFMARPSILGEGVKEGDKEFLTTSTAVKKDDSTKKKRATPKLALDEQVFLDQHNDLCEVCGAPGELLCCASCNLVFHMDCVLPKLHKEPSDDWRCAYCVADGIGGDSSEKRRAIQACKDMEKTRELLQSEKEKLISCSTNTPASAKAESLDRTQEPSSCPVRARTKPKEGRGKPKRQEWTMEEDEELVKLVRIHGENWKDIFNNSRILQRRYALAPSAFHAQNAICIRWRRKHTVGGRDYKPKREKSGASLPTVNDIYINVSEKSADDSTNGAVDSPRPAVERCLGDIIFAVTNHVEAQQAEMKKKKKTDGTGSVKRKRGCTKKVVTSQRQIQRLASRDNNGSSTVQEPSSRPARTRTKPELFVARPSKSGVGVQEGDKEFLTASTALKKDDDNSKKKASSKVALNEQVFLDQHNDLCEVCGAPGELLCCASCNLVFHMDCVLPKLHKEPSDDWRCAYCVADGVGEDSSEKRRAIQACKDMEKTRELLQAFSSRPVRARSKPELFVARPSKSGIGVQEGDKEFLSGSSAAKKLSSEMRVKEGRDKPKRQEFMPRPRSTPKVFVTRPSKQSVGVTLPTICPEVAELKILPKKDRLKKESGHPLCKVEGCTKVGQGSIRDDMCKGHFTLFKKAGRSTKETGEEADKDSSTYLVGKGAVAAEEEEEEEDEAIYSNVAEFKIVPIQDRIKNANGIPFCKVEGCPKQGRNESDQMCRIHYNMFQKAGRSTKESDDDVEEEEPLYPDVIEMKIIPIKDRMKKANGFPLCKVEGCPKQGRSESDQMCRSHFTLFKKAGRSTNETGEEEDEKDIVGKPPHIIKRGRGRPKKNPIAKRPPFGSRKRSQHATTDMAKADSLERAQEPSSRPVRARTKPEQFVARPSKQSVGVEEGDREFLARTTCNSITTNKKYRVEENTQRVISKESDNNVEPSSRPTRTRIKPELFVARPSKSGVGVQEGDEEFLAGTSAAAAVAEKKRSPEMEEGSWECLKCDTFNAFNRSRCTSCMGWKGGRIPSYVDESRDEQSDDEESESNREKEDYILDPTLLTAGLRIVVDVKDSLFKATVVKYREDVEGKNVLIHYDGLKKSSLHWISADMIRKVLKEEDEEEEEDSSSSDEESYSTCESSKKKLWELTKIFTLNEINRPNPTMCSWGDDCGLVACSQWKAIGRAPWNSCLDCQLEDYEGFPEERHELPIDYMTEEHRDIIAKKCSTNPNPAFPDIPTSPHDLPTFMDFDEFEDDDSIMSEMTTEDDSSPPREEFEYLPGTERSDVLKFICTNRTTPGDLTVVQISEQKDCARETLKHFLLEVPKILETGVLDGMLVPPDSLFILLNLQSIVSVYDEEGDQIRDDTVPWDVYAQRSSEDQLNLWVIDQSGEHVGKFELALNGGVYKWYCLLFHLEKDIIDRATNSFDNTSSTDAVAAVVMQGDRDLLPRHLTLALEQMTTCSSGLACRHCDNFKLYPKSESELSGERIVQHIKECNECPSKIRNRMMSLEKSEEYKDTRSLRNRVESLPHEAEKTYFHKLWLRLQHCEMREVSPLTLEPSSSSSRKREVEEESSTDSDDYSLSSYELLRLEKIKRNQAKLASLGLGDGMRAAVQTGPTAMDNTVVEVLPQQNEKESNETEKEEEEEDSDDDEEEELEEAAIESSPEQNPVSGAVENKIMDNGEYPSYFMTSNEDHLEGRKKAAALMNVPFQYHQTPKPKQKRQRRRVPPKQSNKHTRRTRSRKRKPSTDDSTVEPPPKKAKPDCISQQNQQLPPPPLFTVPWCTEAAPLLRQQHSN